ncbi:hypothetical protein I302_100598 [Kwoniella bestiolae CBS 10118]|uniref:Vacuolar fusion protein MON1 n=1 Tax=Kwoniella bestiolae CBS 10118 TaxID=1296100 RepID=A0A1B9G5I0_9TREE|nr:vacuolar fusion protein MON1 [Kwoniella bestiolae CBS 10118]OCF26289.1 vacuolar fusion protein MON1 [Kwoniella bestiolae CBS 10118]
MSPSPSSSSPTSPTRLDLSTSSLTSPLSFPPTPSRTTSQLSITSTANAHLSPPSTSGISPRRRAHSNPNVLSGNRSTPSTPTKLRNANGLLNPYGTLALRSRASSSITTATVASSSRSLFEGLPSSGGTPTSALIRDLDGLSVDKSTHGSGSATPSSSRKGKERQKDVDEGQGVEGEMSVSTGDVRKGLRDLVSRGTVSTASGKQNGGQRDEKESLKTHMKDTKDDPHVLEDTASGITRYTPRRYYVLTNAGKPVFSSHVKVHFLNPLACPVLHYNSSQDNITELMAIASTLISIFQEEDDKIRCIIKGRTRIGFLLKPPLYLFAVSDWGEPEHVLRSHLEYIHLHILSVISSTQLSRMFQRRSNFDLSRLLEGTETFLNKLIDRSQFDFSYLTSTLQPLRMNPATRDMAGAALMPPSKFNDLLYVLLIGDGRIVTLLRPRKHAVHPSDLHLLLNTLASSSTLRSSETWLPICFPKFNPAGFVHAYISYVTEDVGLVFVSADREAFEDLRGWKSIVLEKLKHDKTLTKISESIPLHPYTVSAIGCPGLRHFIYKSRTHIQITQPEWEGPYTEDSIDRKRLITLYQKLHDIVHARSGQTQTYKLVYIRTEHEACLAWLTKPFELYLSVSPQLSKSAVVAAANTVAKWVLAEEGRVFLKDAPVF